MVRQGERGTGMTVRIETLAVAAALTFAGLVAMPSAAQAWIGKPWASGTYVYADFCTAGGERIGRRITLRRSPNGDVLTYEAAASESVRIETASFDDENRSVAFVAKTAQGPVTFRGRVEAGVLTGLLEDAGGARELRLPRVLRARADLPCPGETTGSIPSSR